MNHLKCCSGVNVSLNIIGDAFLCSIFDSTEDGKLSRVPRASDEWKLFYTQHFCQECSVLVRSLSHHCSLGQEQVQLCMILSIELKTNRPVRSNR